MLKSALIKQNIDKSSLNASEAGFQSPLNPQEEDKNLDDQQIDNQLLMHSKTLNSDLKQNNRNNYLNNTRFSKTSLKIQNESQLEEEDEEEK